MTWLLAFVVSFTLACGLTPVVRAAARRWGIVDRPGEAPDRKIHPSPVALLGGVAIFLAFFGAIAIVAGFGLDVSGVFIKPKHLIGMFLGAAVLMVGGYLDDRYRLRPALQFVFPVLATGIVVVSGIGIRYIANPFGGTIHLDAVNLPVLSWHGVTYYVTLWADLFTILWMLGMTYTTKFLDGLDGLVAGITTIGSVAVFVLSIRPPVLQHETATLALILGGACLGFLVWNWHPARIFLGEGGSLLTGFLLGILAIIAGSKVATALLIMGIPILDVVWVIVRRVFMERRSPFSTADRKHLHFRLLDVGFSHRGAVAFLYALTAVASTTTIVFHGREKAYALGVLMVVMVTLATFLVVRTRRRSLNGTGGAP